MTKKEADPLAGIGDDTVYGEEGPVTTPENSVGTGDDTVTAPKDISILSDKYTDAPAGTIPHGDEPQTAGNFVGEGVAKPSTWLDRLHDERADLRVKVDALAAFRDTDDFSVLAWQEKERLHKQLSHMQSYLSILNERLEYHAQTSAAVA